MQPTAALVYCPWHYKNYSSWK